MTMIIEESARQSGADVVGVVAVVVNVAAAGGDDSWKKATDGIM